MQSHNNFPFGLDFNFNVDSPWVGVPPNTYTPVTPSGDFFLLLDGTDFLLLDGTDFLLLG